MVRSFAHIPLGISDRNSMYFEAVMILFVDFVILFSISWL